MGNEERKMTDADVQVLADEMETRLVERFYGNLGRGLWGLVWKVVLLAIIGIAAYGSAKGIK